MKARSDDPKNTIDYATDGGKTSGQAVRDVIDYVTNADKTEQQFYCQGINCTVENAYSQMIAVKEQYGKMDGIQIYHGHLSFKEMDITPELAQRAGMEFAMRMWGARFQVVVTTHLNTEHLHCHFAINSVSFVDGKRLQDKEKSWYYFRHVADDVCREFGLYYDPEAKPTKKAVAQNAAKRSGVPTHAEAARRAIDHAMKYSYTLQDLKARLGDIGYTLGTAPNRKYWTIMRDTWDAPRRLYKLGDGYTEEDIIARIRENGPEVRMLRRVPQKHRSQLRLKGSGKAIRRVGGLRGLYLHYCYQFGLIPARRQQSARQLYYCMGSEIKQADRLSEQTRLLCREHIDTVEQLRAYKLSLEQKAAELIALRKGLYAQAKKQTGNGEPEAAKADIAALNETLKALRKDIRLCENVEERSTAFAERQRKLREEEMEKKEETHHDKWRRGGTGR